MFMFSNEQGNKMENQNKTLKIGDSVVFKKDYLEGLKKISLELNISGLDTTKDFFKDLSKAVGIITWMVNSSIEPTGKRAVKMDFQKLKIFWNIKSLNALTFVARCLEVVDKKEAF